MRQYHDLLRLVLSTGRRKPQRAVLQSTGRRPECLSVFGAQARYDLTAGFPLVTTRRISFKVVREELLWMLSGSTNVKDLQEKGVHIWDAWADEDGDLGPTYGKQLRRLEHSYWVKPLLFPRVTAAPDPGFDKSIVVDYSSGDSVFLGRTIDTLSGPCTVIKAVKAESGSGRMQFLVKFHRTGSVRRVRYGDVQNAKISDLWLPTVYGVGVYGDYDPDDPDYPLLVETWRGVVRRCYDSTCGGYVGYGAKGVHLSEDWLVFANFQKEAKELYNWPLKKEFPGEFSIDKDILCASNRYGRETCMWASREEQGYNTSTGTPFTAVSPTGQMRMFRSFGEALRDCGLHTSAVLRCLRGKLHTHRGWSEFKPLQNDGRVLRSCIVDQVRSVVASLKHEPSSRRHVISMWNPAELPRMALPPCHGLAIQFDVTDGRLSCDVYQRSLDLFIGAPFNVAFYALFTHLLAKVVGLRVGDLIHTVGDLHLYDNHVPQAEEMLRREPYPPPTLVLSDDITGVDGIRSEWVGLEGYRCHPELKGEVAV